MGIKSSNGHQQIKTIKFLYSYQNQRIHRSIRSAIYMTSIIRLAEEARIHQDRAEKEESDKKTLEATIKQLQIR